MRLALTATELTLALLLFADASTVRLREVEGDARLPGRLLLLGLPLAIAIGTLVAGLMFPDIGWAAAAVIATILAPTDAALGLAVFTNPAVPVRIRRALNVESGLNDGLATPFLTLFLALLASEEGVGHGSWLVKATEQIGFAIVAAIAVGAIGGTLLSAARARGWTSHTSEQLVILALALLAYGGSIEIGGNGFVSAFVAGILFGATTRGRMHQPVEFTETLALFLSFVVWTVFGALLVGPVLTGRIAVGPIAYAALSLTIIRMIPVAVIVGGPGAAAEDDRVRRLVRSSWARVGRVHAPHDPDPAPRRDDERHGRRGGDLDDRAVGRPPRSYGGAAVPRLRPVDLAEAGFRPELVEAPEPRVRRRSLRHIAAGENRRTSEMVGEGGVEPPRPFGHRNLNPARLPIPPLARGERHGNKPDSPRPPPDGNYPIRVVRRSQMG